MVPELTAREKADRLADYLRPKVHKDASTYVRPRGTSMVFEIELVHPSRGIRVVAFSHEWLGDHTIGELTRELTRLGIAEALSSKSYLPVLVTNDGVRPYKP